MAPLPNTKHFQPSSFILFTCVVIDLTFLAQKTGADDSYSQNLSDVEACLIEVRSKF